MDTSQKLEFGKPALKRLYEIWPGKNRFFLGGRIMLGPSSDMRFLCLTLLILVTLELMFVLFICPYLQYEASMVILILSLQLFILALFFLAFSNKNIS